MAANKLTAKQKRFVEEYLIDLNATQAAIRAGYKGKNVDDVACQLLRKTQVSQSIHKSIEKRSQRTEITQDEVLKELWSIAKDDIKNYLSFRTEKTVVGYDDGEPVTDYKTIADVKDSDTIDTKNISEISIGKDGQFKFKLYCRDNALLQVGKHLGMFIERSENKNTNNNTNRELSGKSLEELERELIKIDQLRDRIERSKIGNRKRN